MSLTEGIQAERERIRGIIAKYTAADKELARAEAALAALDGVAVEQAAVVKKPEPVVSKRTARAKKKLGGARENALPRGEAEKRIREYLKEHDRIDGGLVALANGTGVPKGSVSSHVVKIEKEGGLWIERQGPTKPIIIHSKLYEGSSNGVKSAQTATV